MHACAVHKVNFNFTKYFNRKLLSTVCCGNYGNVLSRFFGKNFVKVTHLLNKSLKSWFAGKNFSESKFFIFPQCVVLTQIRFFFRGFIFHEIQFYSLIQIFLDGNEYVSRTDNSNHFYHLFMLEFSTSANTIWNGL